MRRARTRTLLPDCLVQIDQSHPTTGHSLTWVLGCQASWVAFEIIGKKNANILLYQIRSISRSVVSDSLRPHESQHARPPCPSPTSGVHSDSRPLSQWCHPAISSSVIPFSCLQFSQHQGLFQWVGFSHQVAKVLELQLQHQSFQWIFKVDFL